METKIEEDINVKIDLFTPRMFWKTSEAWQYSGEDPLGIIPP